MALDYQPMYVLASGMMLSQRKLEVITNNMANVSTPSFKRDVMLASVWQAPTPLSVPSVDPRLPQNNFLYPVVGGIYTDLRQGGLRHTGNSTDLAIDGDGFFAVSSGNEVLYTRKGNFRLDKDGYLVNELGMRILTDNGSPVRVDGDLRITEDGSIFSGGLFYGRLGIYRLEGPQKIGSDLFRGRATPSERFKVLQGFLEDANVNPIEELVKLIEAHRAHEIYTNLIRSLDQLQEKITNQTV
ncbi:fagellar hook-basal body protein [Thermocrinis albus DSM 14484]|uniref:Fagellar hook-basal body protein n=1 Tax=Thermocrinis albus (strain DSM 14484 / JCM 11386 / HI 11/12) TaxID=638303 RepID=D3SLF8_THEAH|nr:flagellar hook-basal body protein [Thermocrinis albus]ADC89588.1 fagellar hook-basal body protein [Thermocrinis albus DSM 14484]